MPQNAVHWCHSLAFVLRPRRFVLHAEAATSEPEPQLEPEPEPQPEALDDDAWLAGIMAEFGDDQ